MSPIKSFVSIATLLLAFGCGEQPVASLPLTFNFALLDSQGHSATKFAQGDPIIFRFQIINNADEIVSLYTFYPAFCDPGSDFFRVYGQAQSSQFSTSLGRACFPQLCTQEGAVGIAAKGTYAIQYAWLSANPACQARAVALPKGHYKTGFRHVFTGNGGKFDGVKSTQTFSIEFDVL